jgi:low affinity Fe/Cu permease
MKNKSGTHRYFDRLASRVTKITGSSGSFLTAFAIIIVWAVSGPFFGFSDTWQLVINTGTTIVTFLMVFVIQQSQNKDTTALQLKLNELIAATRGASNRLIDIEDLSDDELQVLKKFYVKLADLAAKETDILSTHSIDEASGIHQEKIKQRKTKRPNADA